MLWDKNLEVAFIVGMGIFLNYYSCNNKIINGSIRFRSHIMASKDSMSYIDLIAEFLLFDQLMRLIFETSSKLPALPSVNREQGSA